MGAKKAVCGAVSWCSPPLVSLLAAIARVRVVVPSWGAATSSVSCNRLFMRVGVFGLSTAAAAESGVATAPLAAHSEGRSDWFYVIPAVTAVVAIAGPLYLDHVVKHDLEAREIVRDEYPGVYQLLRSRVEEHDAAAMTDDDKALEPWPERTLPPVQCTATRVSLCYAPWVCSQRRGAGWLCHR